VARSRRREEPEENHGNHERWLLTYADMITLLMVLFIVMFAISQVDQRRFDMLKEGLAAGFGQNPSPFQGERSVLAESGKVPLSEIKPAVDQARPDSPDLKQQSRSASDAGARDAYAEAAAEVRRLSALRRQIMKVLTAHGYQHDVALRIDERGLRISLVSRHIVFAANLSTLTPRGERVLDVLAPILHDLPNQIDIDGHTNQIKVKPKYYPTDWELSAARAVTVLRYLHEHGNVPAQHMSAVAYGHEKPLMDPSLPGSQALNKRVDIVVLSGASEDARKLFRQVLRDQRTPSREGQG
jgi:chemotaxis protein MotB